MNVTRIRPGYYKVEKDNRTFEIIENPMLSRNDSFRWTVLDDTGNTDPIATGFTLRECKEKIEQYSHLWVNV